jgi:hypothetical protein
MKAKLDTDGSHGGLYLSHYEQILHAVHSTHKSFAGKYAEVKGERI